MDEDRSRFESLGVSHQNPGKGSRRLFWVMGGLATALFLGGIFYTIFFYMALPNRHTLLKSGENGVDQVPLPVPPTALFPRSAGTGPKVSQIRSGAFIATVSSVRSSSRGLDLILSLQFIKGVGDQKAGVSYVLTPPRWVDGRQGASQGKMSWDQNRLFHPGETAEFPIHFSVAPRTPFFDLYVSFTGINGSMGKRYRLHFENLKMIRSSGGR
ncbi:MAG: hypothetical protein ACYC9S_03185 [Leptospirales bacterium]